MGELTPAIGTIIGAMIAGAVALVGLIISKEQKTSDFRQAWIDALRKSLTEYLGQINAVSDLSRIQYESDETRVRSLQAHLVPLNQAMFDVLLRLNHAEEKSKRVLSSVGTFKQLMGAENLDYGAMEAAQAEFLIASQLLLKSEWKRVKEGERTFRVAKWLAATVVIACALFIVFGAAGARQEALLDSSAASSNENAENERPSVSNQEIRISIK